MAPHLCLDEITDTRADGFGFILLKGLLLVAKTTVPHDFAALYIDIGGREVPGKIAHMDHRQNWVLVRYGPSNTSTDHLDAITLATDVPEEGQSVTFVGIDVADHFHTTKTTITGSFIAGFHSPLKHAEAIDVIQIDSDIARMCSSGVILNDRMELQGFWLLMNNKVRYILPTAQVGPVVQQILRGQSPKARRELSLRMQLIAPKDARVMGVTDEYISQGIGILGLEHRFFAVLRTTAEAAKYIKHGDIILRINGKHVTRYLGFDALDTGDNQLVKLVIVRDGKEITVDFPSEVATNGTTDRVTYVFGMVLQRPYCAVRYVVQDVPGKLMLMCTVRKNLILISCEANIRITFVQSAGSPGSHTTMMYYNFITGVNGIKVHDRDSFLEAVKTIPEEKDFTIQSMDWSGKGYYDIIRKTSGAVRITVPAERVF